MGSEINKNDKLFETVSKLKTSTATKTMWTFSTHSYALGDTGDYDGYVQITNGKDVFQTSGDDIESEQLTQFCELLDLMPDLWSHRQDAYLWKYCELEKQKKDLVDLLNKLKSENMVSVVGEELIDQLISSLPYIN